VVSSLVGNQLDSLDTRAPASFRERDDAVELPEHEQGGTEHPIDAFERQCVGPPVRVILAGGPGALGERLTRQLGQLVPQVAELVRSRIRDDRLEASLVRRRAERVVAPKADPCLLYTSDAADE